MVDDGRSNINVFNVLFRDLPNTHFFKCLNKFVFNFLVKYKHLNGYNLSKHHSIKKFIQIICCTVGSFYVLIIGSS